MNELDKLSSPVDDLHRDEAAEVSAVATTETLSAPENADSETTCVIESSPAMDLAEVADNVEASAARTYHAMTKEEMVEALREIVTSGDMEAHKEVAAIKQAYYSLHNRQLTAEMDAFVAAGNPAEAFSATPDESENEIKNLLSEFREKRNAYLDEKEEERRKNLEEKTAIVDQLKAIVEDIDNINLHFPKFQELQQKFKEVGPVPAGSENDIWKAYQITVEQFYDRWKMNKELRDLDFKKNLELKTALVEKAEALTTLADPIEAFKRLQSLHDEWREIGPVAREIREEIWSRFKEASTVVNKRHQDFFQERKASEQANEDAKTALCEKVEAIDVAAIKSFAEWDNTTKEIIAMQQEWKGLGYASKKMNNVLFARFRKACDDFFVAKAEYFKKSKEEIKDNLAKKEALCEKAEALLERYQERAAFDELQALQKEWRTIGVVRRKQGDEVWKRFCTAVDAFYDARKKLLNGRRDEESENLKAKKSVIERLKEISDDAERRDVIGTIRELQNEWQSIGHVPFKHKDAINTEYRAQLDRLYGAFDMKETRQRMRRFEGEVKKMEGDDNKLAKERDRLVRAMEARQAELKTIENNLGFFNVKSSAGNSMLKDFERKIEKIKEDIAQIKEKIKLLDKQEKAQKAETAE
ncbi:MAG: DUF349 domain-containing protein [Bacteroides sp.]|nr:DUF349 domain-containing protein [Bacteroides sp.]